MGRLPDFIIGGAPRSGTTWLYSLLYRHVRVIMNRPVAPEPKFFLVDDLYRRGLDYYTRTWFSNVPSHCICGEKSTNYLESAQAADRIHKHLPQVKLIFMLREPVARAFSNYLWSCQNGLETETFGRALALESTREKHLNPSHRYSRPHAYFSRGLYAKMLIPYFELFSSDQILCLRYEDIIHKPLGLVQRVGRFLGIQAEAVDALEIGIVNPSDAGDTVMGTGRRDQLRQAYARPNEDLYRMLGPQFQKWEGNANG
jgi:hypothetical protein